MNLSLIATSIAIGRDCGPAGLEEIISGFFSNVPDQFAWMISMKIRSLFIVLLLCLAAPILQAQLHDVKILATREKLDETRERSGNTTQTTKEIIYNLTIESKTFKLIPALEIKYMIFYEDIQAGSTNKARLSSVKGSQSITELQARSKVKIKTKPIKLATQELDAGWYYTSGSSGRARDAVKGVWVRAYADGKMVGEYINPSTLDNKQNWKE
jgi:hypothetical protein